MLIHFLALLTSRSPSLPQLGTLPASDLVPVSASPGFKQYDATDRLRLILGRTLFKGTYWCSEGDSEAVGTYELGGKFVVLRAAIGGIANQSSDSFKDRSGQYVILGDGKPLKSGEVHSTSPPDTIEVNVGGVQKLEVRLAGSAAIGSPTLHRAAVPKQASIVGTQPSPEATVSNGSVELAWKAIPDSQKYCVFVLDESGGEGAARQRCWALSSNVPSVKFDKGTSDAGWFQWEAVAFGARSYVGLMASPQKFFMSGDVNDNVPPQVGQASPARRLDGEELLVWAPRSREASNSPIGLSGREYRGRIGIGTYVEVPPGVDELLVGCRLGEAVCLVDGLSVAKLSVAPNSAEKSLRLSLSPGQSVAILSTEEGQTDGWGELFCSPRPVGTAPAVDAKVVSAPVLRWEPVEGAESYAVRVDLLRTDAGKALPQLPIRGFTTKGAEGQMLLSMADQPAGWYQWRVLGLTSSGVRGKWSTAQRFHYVPAAP